MMDKIESVNQYALGAVADAEDIKGAVGMAILFGGVIVATGVAIGVANVLSSSKSANIKVDSSGANIKTEK